MHKKNLPSHGYYRFTSKTTVTAIAAAAITPKRMTNTTAKPLEEVSACCGAVVSVEAGTDEAEGLLSADDSARETTDESVLTAEGSAELSAEDSLLSCGKTEVSCSA